MGRRSGFPTNIGLLVDWFPRAGFRWQRGQGSPRILRSDSRDDVVRRAIIDIPGGGNAKVRKRDAKNLVVSALAATARMIKDAENGIRPSEGVTDYLERVTQFSQLSRSISDDVWVEMAYYIAHARYEYKPHTPESHKKGKENRLTALAHIIEISFTPPATTVLYYPHTMGDEALDYDIEDDASVSDGEVKSGKDVGVLDDEADKQLPEQMKEVTIQDADGDVEMVMRGLGGAWSAQFLLWLVD
ncbi:hypothetical protein N657DRAFT_680368 [Parathielavia appendiculata]|uniref:Uncharacterized protein n=1 Tax=Parathielavia appendiculata TaxID=2587402 RepID=A0AAN6U3A2_9PEZI|nr:hypothetical protein N657DRAFT_680368 [Parathielavia appendiculata]